MTRRFSGIGPTLLAVTAAVLPAQPPGQKAPPLPRPFQSQGSSSVALTGTKEGEQAVEIVNTAFEITNDSVSGRPRGTRLLLRTTTHSKQILGDEGEEASVTLESWPLGSDPKSKPLYAVKVEGVGARVVDSEVWLVDRTLGDVSWWSVYRLGTGQHLFDTHVDLLRFTVSRADGTPRFAGLEVPPDNSPDARLKEPHVLGVLTYASSDKVMKEALLTCTDTSKATLLRSYADTIHTATLVDRPAGARAIRIVFEAGYPSLPTQTVVTIPIVKDDLDLAHVEAPAGIRAVAWKR